jgi:hypothetical protein
VDVGSTRKLKKQWQQQLTKHVPIDREFSLVSVSGKAKGAQGRYFFEAPKSTVHTTRLVYRSPLYRSIHGSHTTRFSLSFTFIP